MGFGWSFYGFFAAAAAWMVLYFIWAARAAARDLSAEAPCAKADRERGER